MNETQAATRPRPPADYVLDLYGHPLSEVDPKLEREYLVCHELGSTWLIMELYNRKIKVGRRVSREARNRVQDVGRIPLDELEMLPVHEPGVCAGCTQWYRTQVHIDHGPLHPVLGDQRDTNVDVTTTKKPVAYKSPFLRQCSTCHRFLPQYQGDDGWQVEHDDVLRKTLLWLRCRCGELLEL